jgi:hypothetical protein
MQSSSIISSASASEEPALPAMAHSLQVVSQHLHTMKRTILKLKLGAMFATLTSHPAAQSHEGMRLTARIGGLESEADSAVHF